MRVPIERLIALERATAILEPWFRNSRLVDSLVVFSEIEFSELVFDLRFVT